MVKDDFKKGLAIIVGKKLDSEYIKTDIISIHTGCCLGNRIEFLDIANKLPEDEQIYLIGHGSLEELTINDRSMNDIAELLIEKGYNGSQRIYILSCYAASLNLKKAKKVFPHRSVKKVQTCKKKRKSIINKLRICMVGDLKWCLEEKLKKKINDSYIESDARGVAVYIEVETEEKGSIVQMHIIKKPSKIQDFTQYIYLHKKNHSFEFKLSHYKQLILNTNELKNEELIKDVNNYKKKLI